MFDFRLFVTGNLHSLAEKTGVAAIARGIKGLFVTRSVTPANVEPTISPQDGASNSLPTSIAQRETKKTDSDSLLSSDQSPEDDRIPSARTETKTRVKATFSKDDWGHANKKTSGDYQAALEQEELLAVYDGSKPASGDRMSTENFVKKHMPVSKPKTSRPPPPAQPKAATAYPPVIKPTGPSRKQIIREFSGSSETFKQACLEFKLNPKKHFTLNGLIDLQKKLEILADNPLITSAADLRSAAFSEMHCFLRDKRVEHAVGITHHPDASSRKTKLYRLPPALPAHPEIDDANPPFAYHLNFDDNHKVLMSHLNPYQYLLQMLASQWNPDNPVPTLPAISIKTRPPLPATKGVDTPPGFELTTSSLSEPKQIAQNQLLMSTPLANIRDAKGNPISAEMNLTEFNRSITEMWTEICSKAVTKTALRAINAEQHSKLLFMRFQIEASLSMLGEKSPPPEKTITHLYLNRAVIDEYLDLIPKIRE